jgi:PAS domain S-box-containing protein
LRWRPQAIVPGPGTMACGIVFGLLTLTGYTAPRRLAVRDPHPAAGMKSQFRQFIESSPDAIMIVDPEGRIRHANARAAALFGYHPERLSGEPVQALLPDQPLPLFCCDRSGQQQQEASRQLELVASRSDASQFPAEVSVIPVQTGHGPAAVVTVRDITEAQRAQFVLERSLEALTYEDRDRQLLLGHLVRAQEEERRRIAEGIHDDTIQVITAANLRLQQLRHRLREPAELEILGKLEEALQLSLSGLRQLIFDLRPAGLTDGSLAAALRICLKQMRSETGIACQLDDRHTTRIPVDTSVLIYRTAREALLNVRKHARATTVRVELADLSNGCLVRIADDGAGYNPADVENSPGHLGLVLIRERPQIAGGWCRIESAPGAGTTVEFWVPADRPPARPETAP